MILFEIYVIFQKQEEDPTNIYFSNLPDWIGDKALREMLEPYGEVVSTRILRHPVSKKSLIPNQEGSENECEKIKT